jgi:hypothetical protein
VVVLCGGEGERLWQRVRHRRCRCGCGRLGQRRHRQRHHLARLPSADGYEGASLVSLAGVDGAAARVAQQQLAIHHHTLQFVGLVACRLHLLQLTLGSPLVLPLVSLLADDLVCRCCGRLSLWRWRPRRALLLSCAFEGRS